MFRDQCEVIVGDLINSTWNLIAYIGVAKTVYRKLDKRTSVEVTEKENPGPQKSRTRETMDKPTRRRKVLDLFKPYKLERPRAPDFFYFSFVPSLNPIESVPDTLTLMDKARFLPIKPIHLSKRIKLNSNSNISKETNG